MPYLKSLNVSLQVGLIAPCTAESCFSARSIAERNKPSHGCSCRATTCTCHTLTLHATIVYAQYNIRPLPLIVIATSQCATWRWLMPEHAIRSCVAPVEMPNITHRVLLHGFIRISQICVTCEEKRSSRPVKGLSGVATWYHAFRNPTTLEWPLTRLWIRSSLLNCSRCSCLLPATASTVKCTWFWTGQRLRQA